MFRGAKRSAGSRRKPVPPDWSCNSNSFEIRDEWPGLRNGVLYLRQRKRSVVTGGSVPHFRDPEDVLVNSVPGNDVSEAAGHVCGAFFEDANHLVSLGRSNGHLHDESVHFVRSLQI